MAHTTTEIEASRDAVFDVLDDARTYKDWVVGCKEIRAVDPDWPAEGAAFHHTVGIGPLSVSDSTTVVERRRPERLVLRARARPTGIARVTFMLEERDGRTVVRIDEVPVEGLPATLHNPIQDRLIHQRNVETLRRLKRIVEDRRRSSP